MIESGRFAILYIVLSIQSVSISHKPFQPQSGSKPTYDALAVAWTEKGYSAGTSAAVKLKTDLSVAELQSHCCIRSTDSWTL
jgi:hypothetical protein